MKSDKNYSVSARPVKWIGVDISPEGCVEASKWLNGDASATIDALRG
jgi:hypothetical protein